MARRTFLCLAAACFLFCLALLHPPPPPPAQGRRPGLQAATADGYGGRRLLHLLPVPDPRFVPSQTVATEEERHGGEPVTMKKARPAAAWSVTTAPELRAVPGGPDPLHHHGGSPSRRPEQGRNPSSSP